jgi:hypothetical protein
MAPMPPAAQAERAAARAKLDAAERAAADNDTEQAEYLAQQALTHLQLAEARADAVEAQRAADDMARVVDAMRAETSRMPHMWQMMRPPPAPRQ